MIPRQEMAVMTTDMTVEEAAKLSLDEQFTRYPVMKDSKDDIVGVINSRDLFNVFVKKTLAPTDSIESLIQPILQVMETTPISDLLEKMKKEQRHIAILLDEYGGTEGLVTAEDILEEIVGEMRDEFDADEVPDIRKIDVGKYLISGKVLLETVEKLLHIKFEEDSAVSTIGGWILNRKYDVEQGDTFSYKNLEFTVVELENHTIQMVEVAVIES